jgi:hypothetical protein
MLAACSVDIRIFAPSQHCYAQSRSWRLPLPVRETS